MHGPHRIRIVPQEGKPCGGVNKTGQVWRNCSMFCRKRIFMLSSQGMSCWREGLQGWGLIMILISSQSTGKGLPG